MYFRKSLILQRIFVRFQDDFLIKTYQRLQLNQRGRLNTKLLKTSQNFSQILSKIRPKVRKTSILT